MDGPQGALKSEEWVWVAQEWWVKEFGGGGISDGPPERRSLASRSCWKAHVAMCETPVRKWHEMSSVESWEGIFKLGYEAWVGAHQAEIVKFSRARILRLARLCLVPSCAR